MTFALLALSLLAPVAHADDLTISDLAVVQESAIDQKEMNAFLASASFQATGMNRPNIVTAGSSPRIINRGSMPALYNQGSSPHTVTRGTRPNTYTNGLLVDRALEQAAKFPEPTVLTHKE